MNVFNVFDKTKKLVSNEDSVRANVLISKILELNKDDAPYKITKGDDELLLTIKWDDFDSKRREVFNKRKINTSFQTIIKLNPIKNEVRVLDKTQSFGWSVGFPKISVGGSYFQGQRTEKGFIKTYSLNGKDKASNIYHFDTKTLKQSIKTIVVQSGWKYKKVIFGRL